MSTVYVDNPASVKAALAEPWGTVTNGGIVQQMICPLCMACIPANFSDAHRWTITPRDKHTAVHVAVAEALEARTAKP